MLQQILDCLPYLISSAVAFICIFRKERIIFICRSANDKRTETCQIKDNHFFVHIDFCIYTLRRAGIRNMDYRNLITALNPQVLRQLILQKLHCHFDRSVLRLIFNKIACIISIRILLGSNK